MTIKQMAEELKISPQAIYQRLKKSKVDVRKLVDYQTRELTADGEYTIRKLFSHDASEQKQTDKNGCKPPDEYPTQKQDQTARRSPLCFWLQLIFL